MVLLVDVLPEFVSEVEVLLIAAKREDVARQLRKVTILGFTHDPSCDAAYVYVQSSRPLNVIRRTSSESGTGRLSLLNTDTG